MASTLINQNDPGMAMLETQDFHNIPLQTGDTPVTSTPEVVADAVVATVDLPAYSVVGRDSAGKLVLAVYAADPEDAIPAIGITTATVLAGSTRKNVAIYRTGMFNPAALNWDDSFDTDEKKRLAFEGSQDGLFIRSVGYPAA